MLTTTTPIDNYYSQNSRESVYEAGSLEDSGHYPFVMAMQQSKHTLLKNSPVR